MIDVVAAIIEKKGRFLIARRKKGKHLEGKWEFPGGRVEDSETHGESLRRELKEEFGIEIEVKNFLGESIFNYDEREIALFGYYATHISGDFKLTDHDMIEWIYPNEFGNYDLAEADIPLAERVASNYQKPL